MNTAIVLAALALVPQPAEVVEKDGFCSRTEVAYVTDPSIPAEGYRLSVTTNGITVTSSDKAGAYYAGMTLEQLAVKVGKNSSAYPCVEITDSPRYRWRGIHFDDCRHFFGKEEVKKTLDIMAKHKLNRFHWHLTEDQGWRLEIPGYPELVKYGAVRSASPKHGLHPSFRWKPEDQAKALNGEVYGPFYYTESDVSEILAYAAERHIQVVPEIELPGHFQSVVAAYPEFTCFPDPANRDPLCVWGISENVMCIGNDKAVKFMEDVLDYVCRLFPGDVIHIGGDECPQKNWKKCPKCQARIKAENLGDEHGLQPWITKRFIKFLEARGKRVIGWDEYLLGDVPVSAMGMNWREARQGAGHELINGITAAVKGHDIVMSPLSYCYLDFRQGLEDDPFQYIGGNTTLARCHSFDPCAGVPEEAKKHIIGGQGNNWSEYTWNGYDLEWKMWPRACALAEVLWTGEKKPSFDDFLRRMTVHRKRLIKSGVNCAPLR